MSDEKDEVSGVGRRIAGKTYSEILLMNNCARYRWYKTILPEEKEKVMRKMENVRRIKLSESHIGKILSEDHKAKIRAVNIGKFHTEASRAKNTAVMIERWKNLEYRISMMGENAPMYGRTGEKGPGWIDGRTSDLQYKRRYYLRRLGLPDEFVELALNQKKKRTDIELMMEYWLINSRISYKFQKYIKLLSTCTYVDFFIEPNICLYCDGNRFHELEKRRISDERITRELESLGYKVIRIWGSDIRDGVRPLEVFELPQLKYKQQILGSRRGVL